MGAQLSKYRQALDAFDEASFLFRSDTQRYAGLMAKAMAALAEAERELLDIERKIKVLELGEGS